MIHKEKGGRAYYEYRLVDPQGDVYGYQEIFRPEIGFVNVKTWLAKSTYWLLVVTNGTILSGAKHLEKSEGSFMNKFEDGSVEFADQ